MYRSEKEAPRSLNKKLLIGLALGFLIYIAAAFYADLNDLVEVGARFPWTIVPLVLALAFGNYVVRMIRWHYYMKVLKVGIGLRDSAIVFFAGLAMSVTPGKFGELLKAVYIKNINGTNRRQSGPAILAERLTDLVGVLLLASIGIFSFNFGKVLFIICLLGIIGLMVVLTVRPLFTGMLRLFSAVPFIRSRASKFEEAYDNVAILLNPVTMIVATALSIVAWGCEGLGFYIILRSFADVSLFTAYFIYAFSILIGAVSMLPGGLLFTEGTMTMLLENLVVPRSEAVAATLITRLATLWFAVILGLAVTGIWRKKLRGSGSLNEAIKEDTEE